MNKLIMGKYIKYIRTILIHKWYVFIECYKQGIIWQGVVHDLSKYTPSEFLVGCKYYQGNRSPNNAEREDTGVSTAWLHHKGRNKHHWEYWVDWDSSNGEYILTKIPLKYMKEMYADMIGASKAYNKDKFDVREPYKYFLNSKIIMEQKSWSWLRNKLEELANSK